MISGIKDLHVRVIHSLVALLLASFLLCFILRDATGVAAQNPFFC